MLLKEDAIDFDFYGSGRVKSRRYIYNCRQCPELIKVRTCKLESHSGLCFNCSLANRTLRPYESTYNSLLSRHIKRAYPGGPISYEEFLEFTKIGECCYCLTLIQWNKTRVVSATKRQTSCVNLDRLDSDLGYSAGNLVVCCPRCNFFKSSFVSVEAMKEIGPILAKYDTGAPYRGGTGGPIKKMSSKQRSFNCQRGVTAPNKTGFRGVHIDHARGGFIAKAKKNNRIVFLGRHDTAEAAARAYDAYALETYGEHANLNFPLPVAA